MCPKTIMELEKEGVKHKNLLKISRDYDTNLWFTFRIHFTRLVFFQVSSSSKDKLTNSDKSHEFLTK